MKKTALFLAVVMLLSALAFSQSAVAAADNEYPHIEAGSEDPDMSLWFDYATQKVKPGDVTSTGMNGFKIYMAKNEIEDAQFVLLSTTDRTNLEAELTELSDGNGNELAAEIYIELYSDCASYGMIPDAMPPLSACNDGTFSLTAGSTQAFIIRVKTTEDTVAGDYEAELSIYDENSNELKRAILDVHVWDFALSEETACATSINLSRSRVENQATAMGVNKTQMYVNYYDYLLENRICSWYLPYEANNPKAIAYMDNPRVNSFALTVSEDMNTPPSANYMRSLFNSCFSGEEGQKRFEKSYLFSGVVDADSYAKLEALRAYYNARLSEYSDISVPYTDVPFNLINTYFFDIDYPDGEGGYIDQIEYYSDFLNFWCSKPFAYTEEWELTTPGAKVMQDSKWDDVYGTFKERMAEKREAGQRVWWFLSWDNTPPYIDYYIQTDGVAQRVLFWQQYDNDVQGFLLNFSNYWIGDPYTNTQTSDDYPNAHGESAFIYPGSNFGLTVPVGSLRLEAMRDGIEDYQMFRQLEELLGDGTADGIIDEMTTGMVHYSTSDSEYYETRKLLGNALEAATLGNSECPHHFVDSVTVPATCVSEGQLNRVCDICGYSYNDTIPATGHRFENGFCAVCGAEDPDAVFFTPGDINEDGKVNAVDTNVLNKILTGTYSPTENQRRAADIDGSDKIDAKDSQMLQRMLTGVK